MDACAVQMGLAMKRLAILAGGLLLGLAGSAQAENAGSPTCKLVSNFIVSQDRGTVTISCSGVTQDYGDRLAELLTEVVQHRLDPETVIAKLGEIERAPEAGKPRAIDETQRQAIVQALVNKPSEEIAIFAHPQVDDAADYGKAIATTLLMVGWQIQGREIKRAVPPRLDDVKGVAVLVPDKNQPPRKALLLRAALTAAHIVAPILTEPSLTADATALWIGRRPQFMSAAQKP
jgi:hypothetical protein